MEQKVLSIVEILAIVVVLSVAGYGIYEIDNFLKGIVNNVQTGIGDIKNTLQSGYDTAKGAIDDTAKDIDNKLHDIGINLDPPKHVDQPPSNEIVTFEKYENVIRNMHKENDPFWKKFRPALFMYDINQIRAQLNGMPDIQVTQWGSHIAILFRQLVFFIKKDNPIEIRRNNSAFEELVNNINNNQHVTNEMEVLSTATRDKFLYRYGVNNGTRSLVFWDEFSVIWYRYHQDTNTIEISLKNPSYYISLTD